MWHAASVSVDRAALLDRFRRIRARTRALFDLIDEAAYYRRPIPLRNPIVFDEGHLPAFAVNTFVKRGLGRPGVDERLEEIFARGIDPESEAASIARGNPAWPARKAVQAYAAAADEAIQDAIAAAEIERPGHPLLDRSEALWAILEHEEMHQETLAYLWHRLPYELKRKPEHYVTLPQRLTTGTSVSSPIPIPAGTVTMGTGYDDGPFAWDNERPPHQMPVEAFHIDLHNVTNAEFEEFVKAGGYRSAAWWRPEDWAWIRAERVLHPRFWQLEDGRWFWRGMFDVVPLPDAWPVYVSWAEAQAYARWRGARLPTEAEFHRAAFGALDGPDRRFPWGNAVRPAESGRVPGNFDFVRWDPDPVGAHPEAASAFGVHDLVGNGWEWTSSVFAPFDGFAPTPSYPEYSADFFDGRHFVLKGASPVTSRTLVRRGFRNWFRPHYPFVYASFRCVTGSVHSS